MHFLRATLWPSLALVGSNFLGNSWVKSGWCRDHATEPQLGAYPLPVNDRRQKAAVPELRSPLETIRYAPCCPHLQLCPLLAVRVLHGDPTVPKSEDVAARDLHPRPVHPRPAERPFREPPIPNKEVPGAPPLRIRERLEHLGKR